jgi:hypothetical protein
MRAERFALSTQQNRHVSDGIPTRTICQDQVQKRNTDFTLQVSAHKRLDACARFASCI